MISITFMSFAKRENSTLQPASGIGTTYSNCTIKAGCSIVSPSIELSLTALDNPSNYNYCYIPMFSRYYFIDDWQYVPGLWIAQMHVDVLASFKTEIGNSNFYVTRASYDSDGYILYNGNVVDDTYPILTEAATYTNVTTTNPLLGTGCFVVGVINSLSNFGAVSYYIFTAYEYKVFMQNLFNTIDWAGTSALEISNELLKALLNPIQYVVSCMWLPFTIDSYAVNVTKIPFGFWEVSGKAMSVTTGVHVDNVVSLTIPRHPQYQNRGAYLNVSPYSYYALRFYPFGLININSEDIANWNTLDLHYTVDIVSGRGILNIAVNGSGNPIRTIEAQVGVEVPVGSVNVNLQSFGTASAIAGGAAAVKTVASNASSEHYGGFLGGAIDAIKNTWNSLTQGGSSAVVSTANNITSAAVATGANVELTGQAGCVSGYTTQSLTLTGKFFPIAAEDLQHRGRPYMGYRTINTLSGFVQCSDCDIAINCADRERIAISSYLASGFYYE